MTPRREYGEGSVHQHHVKDCPRPKNAKGESTCGCKWRGTLEAGYTEQSKRRRVTVTGKTEAEVRRKLRKRKEERARAEARATVNTRATVASYSQTWLPLRERTVRPSTYTSDVTAVRRYIVPTLGRVRLVDLTLHHFRDLEAAARKAGLPTALRAHRALTKMLNDAVNEGHAVPAAMLRVDPPGKTAAAKGRPRPKRDALTTPEAVAVLSRAATRPDGVRWLIGFMQGARQGEVLGMEWDRVDLERGILDISWQLQPLPYREKRNPKSGFRLPDDYEARHLVGRFCLVRPKTAGSERLVPMVPTVARALAAWREVAPENPHGLVFARENGWPIDKADDAALFTTLQTEAEVAHPSGRPYVGHEMRNTAATLLLELGVDETVRMAILGHNSYAAHRGYLTAREGAMRQAMAGLEQTFAALEG